MNFNVISMRFVFVTLLYFSAIKTAHIPDEEEQSTRDVLSFLDVYNKSFCQPREVLVDIMTEYPDEVEHIFIPSCVVLTRCAGCCHDEALECTPISTHNVTMEIKVLRPKRQQSNVFKSFTEHSMCACREKKAVKEVTSEKKPRKGKGKGQKRKRKKIREQTVDLPTCEPCCSSCTDRRRRLFVQDPQTCKCFCKHSESDCRARSLELNERTCKCDKPRR
ncbi:vascular endothelial growth factor Ab isoform X2 [Denticeps clupeoides]|uniref:Platelet-derived growth factor (PDGF) family profile domain-containing protein n=1 Tax=Denticeps clupeoides TaxID=299321 RepID=A0AAY4BLV3_9TELE|nr:vascular endothelial growth factor A isoform X2 [Denticeps clupeoides]